MYTYDAIVRYTENGGRMKATAASIANYFQDCAILHSEEVGTGIEYLKEHHRAWFLVSWQIVVDRYPALGEHISVGTWAYDFKGSTGYRNLVIRDSEGTSIVKAATLWSYVDTDTMRPARIDDEMADSYAPLEPKLDMNYAPRKIKLLDELTEIDRRRVMVYQMDSNHHMNNEAYIDLALEYITNVEDIKEIRAEYKKQFVKDELIVIKTGEKDGIKQFTFWDVQGTLRCIVNFS